MSVVGDLRIDERQRLVGWAFDPRRPKHTLALDILVDGERIATLQASMWSHDAGGLDPNATFSGFEFAFPDTYHDARPHVAEVRVGGGRRERVGEPLVLESLERGNRGQEVLTTPQFDPRVAALGGGLPDGPGMTLLVDREGFGWTTPVRGTVIGQNRPEVGSAYGHRAYRRPATYVAVSSGLAVDPAYGGVYTETGGMWQASRYLANQHAVSTARRILRDAPATVAPLDGPAIVFCNSVNKTFFHWHLDGLAGLVLARAAAGPGVRVLAPPLNAWQAASLKLLGVEPTICEAPLYRPERLITTSHLDGRGAYPDRWVLRLFEALKDGLKRQQPPRPAPTPPKVFISREDAPHRILHNEDELWRALEPLGFVRFVPGRAAYEEQIAMFAGAEVIVASHGSALTNIGFCRPRTQIIEILPQDYVNGCFRYLAVAAGLNHFWYTTPLVQPFAVDVADFMRECRERRLFDRRR